MKAINFFITILIAALIFGYYSPAYADSLNVTEKKVALSSRVIGKYPQISDMDSLNDEISKFISDAVIELANQRDFSSQASANKIFDYAIEYNGDYAKLQIFINKPTGIILKAADKKEYYIDTLTNTLITEEVYNTEPEIEVEEIPADEPVNDGPIELSSIYYYRLRDIADHLGYELDFFPSVDGMPSGADIIYIFEDESVPYPVVVATVFSGSSLVFCDGDFFDIGYPVEHLDSYIYIPSTLVDWLADILYYDAQ